MDKNRETAYLALLDIEKNGAYSNIALNHKISAGKPSNPAFVRELVYGVIERKLTLDYFIDKLLAKGIKSLKTPELLVLRMGVYQLHHMDSVPEYAAVNESVNLAKKYAKGRVGLVNGILHGFIRKKDDMKLPDEGETPKLDKESRKGNQAEADTVRCLSIRYSYAPWIVELWLTYYGRKMTERLLEAGNRRPPLSIRVNTLKTDRKRLIKTLREQGYEAEPGNLCENAVHVKGSGILDTELFSEGFFTVQDESSMLVAEKIGVLPGELVLDVCAAPGGKTTAMAERMENTGRIIASDIYEKKAEIIRKDAARLGLRNIETRQWDARNVDPDLVGKADRVLVDAPCSGLGVVRRKPEIKYKEKTKDLKSLPGIQLEIIEASSAYAKPGGTLLYSTCTVNPEENENVIESFLMRHGEYEKCEETLLLPTDGDSDGFFICVMKRRA